MYSPVIFKYYFMKVLCKKSSVIILVVEDTWQIAATCSRCFLAHGFFYPEDGGDMFLRNVGSHKIYTAPHLRRRHSS
jgi:hypothetical protein